MIDKFKIGNVARMFIRYAIALLLSTAQVYGHAQVDRQDLINAKLITKQFADDAPSAIYELQVPKDYFRSQQDRKTAQSRKGLDTLFLWLLIPTLDGITDKTISLYSNDVVPNRGVNLSIRAVTSRDGNDVGKRRLDVMSRTFSKKSASNSPPSIDPGSRITIYRSSKTPKEYVATFPQDDGTLVFIQCGPGLTCRAIKTWRHIFVVDYFFFRASFEEDFRHLDETIDKVIASFQPKRL